MFLFFESMLNMSIVHNGNKNIKGSPPKQKEKIYVHSL